MYNLIKDQFRRSFFAYNTYLSIRYRLSWVEWLRRGKPIPPPHFVKQRCVMEYGRTFNLPVLVETGTFKGEMARAVGSGFREIYTIELGQALYAEAKRLFAPFPHIHVLQGDSGKVLRKVLDQIEEPCLFWLDAHYSGAGTEKGDHETPVLDELSIIFSHTISNHVILIDDARCFNGLNAYPALADIETSVSEARPGWIFRVQDDIIRIHPIHEPESVGQ